MRTLDMKTWHRREHFELFNAWNHPHFGMCANVEVTQFHQAVKARGYSFTVAIVYLIARTANAIPEFRYRIRGDQVVEHEIVHPGFTILVDEDRFSFCNLDYYAKYSKFAAGATEMIAQVKANLVLQNDPNRDDMIYMTPIPWVSFTSFMHPMQFHPGDCIPRFAWGKFFQDGELLKMPLGVQGHHALMDGLHVGRYYEKIQDFLHQPEGVLGE